jgi:hypothetical protein
MNIALFGDWLDVIYKIGVVVFAVWLYLDRRNDKTHLRISSLEKDVDERLDGHADRITKLEVHIKSAPGHHDLAEIYKEMRKLSESLSKINSSLSAQSATMTALKDLVGRMDSFWRHHDK